MPECGIQQPTATNTHLISHNCCEYIRQKRTYENKRSCLPPLLSTMLRLRNKSTAMKMRTWFQSNIDPWSLTLIGLITSKAGHPYKMLPVLQHNQKTSADTKQENSTGREKPGLVENIATAVSALGDHYNWSFLSASRKPIVPRWNLWIHLPFSLDNQNGRLTKWKERSGKRTQRNRKNKM